MTYDRDLISDSVVSIYFILVSGVLSPGSFLLSLHLSSIVTEGDFQSSLMYPELMDWNTHHVSLSGRTGVVPKT